MSKIDEFKEYARKRIADKLRAAEEGTVNKSVIKPYDGEDAFYSGSDEEYKEFLDELDVDMNDDDVLGSTQKFNLNVKEVVGKVKETATKVTEKATDITSNIKEKVAENAASDFIGSYAQIDEKIGNIESRLTVMAGDNSEHDAEIKESIEELKKITEQIRDELNGVSKLNDSVFDLKNSQQNTKNAITELQSSFARLKKKTVTGIIILSVIGFIVIAMEVINLLA